MKQVFAILILALGLVWYFQHNVWLRTRCLGWWGSRITGDTSFVDLQDRMVWKSRAGTLEVSRYFPENAKVLLEDREYRLKELFSPSNSPYPDQITNQIECSKEYWPKEYKVSNGKAFVLKAGVNGNYGVCAEDLAIYNSVYVIQDCGKQGVYEMRVYGGESVDKLKEKMVGLGCLGRKELNEI